MNPTPHRPPRLPRATLFDWMRGPRRGPAYTRRLLRALLAALLLAGHASARAQADLPLEFDHAYQTEMAAERAALRARIQQWPAPLRDANQQIAAALRANDVAQALRLAENLSQRDPGNADVRNFLARLQSANGQQAAAVKLLDEAIRLDPDNRWFYVNKAGAQAELRDLSGALATARTLTARYPQWSIGLNLEAALLDGLGRVPQALQAYQRALAATPSSAQILTNQGLLLQRLGREAEARASYEAALRVQPGYSRAAAALASLPR
ncbi:tetratricopeptide repeat protein [Achromobacter sp.]|uniref:tetratricopeptide repeat protein n=1 Tax=Achromobacter sp. TaxID=134375 RepID=UPI003D080AE4